MTALAIYNDNSCASGPFFPDIFSPMLAFVVTAFVAIAGVFLADSEDVDDGSEDYLSDAERAALEEEDDDDGDYGTDDDDGGESGNGDGEGDDDPGETKQDDLDPGSDEDEDKKDDDDKESDGEDSKPDTDLEDNADKVEEKEKPKSATDTGEPDTAGDVSAEPSYEDNIKALEQELDDGKIEFDDYKKRLRALDIENVKAISRQEAMKTHAEIKWKEEQAVFFKDNAELVKGTANPIVYSAFVSEVNRLAQNTTWNDKTGTELLLEAKKNVLAAFNISTTETPKPREKTEGEQAVDKAKKSQADKKAPKSLKDVPASDKNTDNPFDYIDNLEGAAYEKAIAKLSDAELEAYENSN